MGSIRKTSKGMLFFDFQYKRKRCREYTSLPDTQANRNKLKKILKLIQAEINEGTFDYGKYFPDSKQAAMSYGETALIPNPGIINLPVSSMSLLPSVMQAGNHIPVFGEFIETWYGEMEVGWRRTHKKTVRGIVDKYLKKEFEGKSVGHITKTEIMAFRTKLAKVPGRKGDTLSNKRINAIMGILAQVLNEAADRYQYISPYNNIKPLKVPRTDVLPFTLLEVQQIITTVRNDYKNYYLVRFFTGMRTGEIDGLKWKYIDFEKRLILVRETVVDGQEDYTKTDGSQREIQMSQVVYDALLEQAKVSRPISKFVFCNNSGNHVDHNNVTKRVWYPLLRHLGIDSRRPYQTRHTAATLWLAAGENPEWIARQMGHSSTEMLFRVYSRYVPNLTRKDGSAFERLLTTNFNQEGDSYA